MSTGGERLGSAPGGGVCCGPDMGCCVGYTDMGGGVSYWLSALVASAGPTPSSRLRPHLRRRGERPASRLKPFITSAKVGSEAGRRSSSGPELIGHPPLPADRDFVGSFLPGRSYRVTAAERALRARRTPAAPRGPPG